ncbi:MAG: FAD-dependent oxidoreductase [Bacteroidota bacterium]
MRERIAVLGGGMVGTLFSILLVKRGFRVEVFEKRPDPRKHHTSEGRSINLALSHRGIRALKMAEVYDEIKPVLLPMYGRKIHTEKGIDFHPYGQSDQFINSVSRHELNAALIEQAERSGASFHFEHLISEVDPKKGSITIPSGISHHFDFLVGADGALSLLRKTFEKRNASFHIDAEKLAHGYKELTIAPRGNEFAIDPKALHIWPRNNYMLIALPNPDKSFTCTLFLANKGDTSFENLKSPDQIRKFIEASFPDIPGLIPDVVDQFLSNPTSYLQTIRASPWVYEKSLLLGDAAHAIVPFYGQGMNAGFEDCRILIELLESNNYDWNKSVHAFQDQRKQDTDAIAELALQNFLEMRAHVIDEAYLKRKELEARLFAAFPDEWLPLYSMVTFSDTPYHEALRLGRLQKEAISSIDSAYDPKTVDLEGLINTFKRLKQAPR